MKNKFIRIEITLSDTGQPIVEIKSENLNVIESQIFTYISNEQVECALPHHDFTDTANFSKKNKGVLVHRDKQKVKISNDPFCTIPLYYFKTSEKIIITSEPYDFNTLGDADIDQAGLWESILFGSCLWNRTLFKGLFQLPSASELIVTDEGLSLERYWDFNVEEDSSLKNEKNLIEALDSKLTDIFTNLPEKPYLMGISGGLDSRLSAAYLHKANKAHLVKTFTYCSTKQSLDYQLAKKVCHHYGLKEPSLHILNEASYRSQLNFLSKYTCGQIGIQHSHICSVLESNFKPRTDTQISNYFSDALFGFDCSGNKHISMGSDSLTRTLNSTDGLSMDIRCEIEADISNIFSGFNPDANYSSLNEYKYVTERNQKFHMNLAFQQSRFMDTCLPYANSGLLEFMMSVPLPLRKHKKVLDLLFESGAVKGFEIADISSRHFIAGNEFSNQGIQSLIKKFDFKLQNTLSALIAKVTQGKMIYPNKYHTESHVNMLHKFSGELKVACDSLYQAGIFNEEQQKTLSTIPVKSGGVSERFQVLSLISLLQ
ncbi:hypothetical protein [Pseudoalteromonas sp. 120-MNA-CIBAN-0494]|uniref:hypothetical protein n=1 Tax=unclassified Pseudoalteromonas TaxID=194690 RepID=UPI00332A8700